MTKELYFQMCESLGTQPIESEIPVGLEDLPDEISLALAMWQKMPDDVDSMTGKFYGKQLLSYPHIFPLYDIPKEDYSTYFNWLYTINVLKVNQYNNKNNKKPSALVKAPQP